ncbi:MAG: M48 family metalloprotease [Pseudomonadales bacterium]|nr:M48 family metalloprotease [Pseudomonadales bacterium]
MYEPVRILAAAGLAWALVGCVVNPVTGEREVGFISVAQQISMGERNYVPAQQMQGGLYQVDPGVTEYVRAVGMRLAAVSGVDLPYEFVVLNNSVPNAWAMPGGKLAINRGLLTELGSEAELAAVLGHEIVHAAGRHGAKAVERGVLSQVALLGVAIGTHRSEYSQALVGGAALAAGLVNQRYGRDAEREADYYGTRYLAAAGYDPMAAVTLQETFVRLSEGRSTSWLEGLFASHPPSTERVANNRRLVETLRAEGFKGGNLGVEPYTAALRQLREDADAYAAADEARKALAARDYAAARTAAQKAIRLQNREAAFHGLLGDIERGERRFDRAIAAYDAAIARDDGYFAYYLGRGLARNERGARTGARDDFDRSVALLPTAIAFQQLGRLAEADGNVERALELYQAAAQSESPAGVAARTRALELDLPRNPARYLQAAVDRDARGRLLLTVANGTPVAVEDVLVRIETLDDQGQRQRGERRLRRIEPGASRTVVVLNDAARLVDARAAVAAARPATAP